MARTAKIIKTIATKPKCSSQGLGGRGRSTKIGLSTMNKHRKRSYKGYRGQGK